MRPKTSENAPISEKNKVKIARNKHSHYFCLTNFNITSAKKKNTMEKKFHRDQYPLKTLAEFGLTKEMIYDLPDFVHEIIESGGQSPLLPIKIQQPFGYTHAHARFFLINTKEGTDVLFIPKLETVNLDTFTRREKDLLLSGKVIVANINETKKRRNNKTTTQTIKAFVQLDKDTNSVVYTPTPVIGRNLNAIANEYDISGEDLQSIWNGEIITIMDTTEPNVYEPVTIGVDLFSDKGVVIIPGTASRWENTVRRTMPEYSFGNDGCWINKDGKLEYIPEDDFTEDIIAVLHQSARKNGIDLGDKYDKEREKVQQVAR